MRIDPDVFDRWVGEAYKSLPEQYRRKLVQHDVTVRGADRPIQDTSENDEIILGQFIGTPLPQQQQKQVGPTPRILLYQHSFEIVFNDDDQLRDQVKRTLLHEVGHFLGKNEQELHELEKKLYGSK